MQMSAQKIIRTVREALMNWGVVARPAFHLRRHPAGTTRARLTGRGTCRRMRHVSLQRLLR
jgi:hypothetical protein